MNVKKKNYCYEILENIRNFINFSFRDNINKNNIIITLNENKNDKIQIVKNNSLIISPKIIKKFYEMKNVNKFFNFSFSS